MGTGLIRSTIQLLTTLAKSKFPFNERRHRDKVKQAEIMGRDPVTVEKDPDGKERVKEVMHYWRVFQRNVPDFSKDSQGTAF